MKKRQKVKVHSNQQQVVVVIVVQAGLCVRQVQEQVGGAGSQWRTEPRQGLRAKRILQMRNSSGLSIWQSWLVSASWKTRISSGQDSRRGSPMRWNRSLKKQLSSAGSRRPVRLLSYTQKSSSMQLRRVKSSIFYNLLRVVFASLRGALTKYGIVGLHIQHRQLFAMKQQGQEAVNRIIEIREVYPKTTNLAAKQDYVKDFKGAVLKLVAYLKTESNAAIANQLKAKLPGLEEELKRMKAELENSKSKQTTNATKLGRSQGNNDKKLDKDQQEMQNGIAQAIVRQKPNIKWEDVGGLEQAKTVLQEAVILPIKFPEVFIGQRTPWRGILLYGPPGTGKTFLAKACATEMKGGTFFSISASDLMSKYVGQSQKTLRGLFEMARKERPSIIFIDEIDSIAGERSSDENEVSRRVKTQFLIQMQGVGNDCKDVLVLGATNLPWAIDSAVRRRFEKRVYIPLPDIKARLAMLKKAIAKNNMALNPQQLSSLGELTQGYSGSDISNMVNDALMSPVRTLDKTRLWKEVNDNGVAKYSPVVNANQQRDPTARYFQGTMDQLKSKGFTIVLITTYDDFVAALKNSKPSVSPNDIHKYIEWTKAFGVEG